MRLRAVVFKALGLMSYSLLAQGIAAQPAPAAGPPKAAARPVAPVATTFDAVHAGKHLAGKAVEFPIVLLPETAIRNTKGSLTTYYVLGVRKDGPYMKAVE